MLYSPSGIVLSGIQQSVFTNLEYLYLGIPSCRAVVMIGGRAEGRSTLNGRNAIFLQLAGVHSEGIGGCARFCRMVGANVVYTAG